MIGKDPFGFPMEIKKRTKIYINGHITGIAYAVKSKGTIKGKRIELNSSGAEECEYYAIIEALKHAKEINLKCVQILGSNQTVMFQLTRKFKAKKSSMIDLRSKVEEIACGLDVEFKWIPHNENIANRYLN